MIVIPTLQIRTFNIFKNISSLPLSCQNVQFWNQVIYQYLCQRWTVSSHFFLTIGYGLSMQKYGLFYSKTKETIFTNYIQTKILLVPRFSSALFSSAVLEKQMIIEFFASMMRILHEFKD
jgi:hypothetical protein